MHPFFIFEKNLEADYLFFISAFIRFLKYSDIVTLFAFAERSICRRISSFNLNFTVVSFGSLEYLGIFYLFSRSTNCHFRHFQRIFKRQSIIFHSVSDCRSGNSVDYIPFSNWFFYSVNNNRF